MAPMGSVAWVRAIKMQEVILRTMATPIANPPASAKDAYPISGLSFLLVRKDSAGADEQKAVKDFIAYAVAGGQSAAEGLYYAKLPEAVQQQNQTLLGQLTPGGHAVN